MFHYGIDISANTGTDVLCFADGVVESVGVSSVYGNT
jgi:murein DD-endopeptidase MepM/ murein hydrolase activator NlpD